MKPWITFILIAFLKPLIAQSELYSFSIDSFSKTHLISDDPFLEMLDSLHEAQIFNKNPVSYNVRDLNIHNFPLDSIPEYSDSVLQLRFEDMNTFSPIQFTFNSKVKRCIDLYSKNRRQILNNLFLFF